MHDIFLTLWRHRGVWFLPIWITLSVVAAITSALLVGAPAGVPLETGRPLPTNVPREPRFNWSGGTWVAVGLFCFFVVGFVILILVGEHFDYNENSQLTLYTLKGHDYPPPIWPQLGRFFPLAFQEFNVIRHFGTTTLAFHAFPIFQLLVVCFLLLTLDQELAVTARVCLAVFLLLSPGVVISFGDLIYPDRNVIFWLLCLATFVKRFDQCQTTAAAVAAIVSAQFMLYYKETAFLLLWGFVAGRLLLRCKDASHPAWNFGRLRERASRLDLCLFSLGLIFLLYYCAATFRHMNLQYANEQRLPEMEVLLCYFKMDLLAWLFVFTVIVRAYLIWKRNIVPSPFWEGLAYGGLAYFGAFLWFGMLSAYYLAPVDVIAVLYLGRLAVLSWRNQKFWNRIAVTMALCGIFAQNISLSSFREFERKNLVREKDEIAGVIRARYREDQSPLRLFFPFASPQMTEEFAAYLSYRGIPVEGAGDEPMVKDSVVLVCHALATDGPLIKYRSIIGHAGNMPRPGDLVIVLPDDDVSLAQVSLYLHGSDMLFSSQPRPRIPHWLFRFYGHCHVASPEFERKKLPDHWLYASVAELKQPASSYAEP